MTIPNWEDDPEAWDGATIGGERLPGIVIPDAETSRDLDEQKAKGKKGAKIKNNGDPARKPKLLWQFTAEQWPEAQRIRDAVLDPRKSSKLEPLDIVQPVLNWHGITTVLVRSIKGPQIERGLASVVIELIEAERPKPAPALGSGSTGLGAAGADQLLAAQQQQLMQIEATIYQLEAMRGGLIGADPAQVSELDQKIAELKSKKIALLEKMGKPSKKGAAQSA